MTDNDTTPTAATPDEQAVLAANQAFYEAFQRRDTAAMDAVWGRTAPIACIHPGWDALTDRSAILESWRQILDNPMSPPIHCREARAFVRGDTAFVICHEVIEGRGMLVATNLFSREDGGWRMVHHQAGPLAAQPRPRPETPPEHRRLH